MQGNVVRVGHAEAEVICHSVVRHHRGPEIPLITVRARYWRAIHSELMTHCVFSRNARSSRAVPTPRLLKEDAFFPNFGMNIPGMQAGDAASPELQAEWEQDWLELIVYTRSKVAKWSEQKMHKQWANRPLEWFGWIDTLVTATDWANFYALRDHHMAAPEIQDLAKAIRQAIEESTPTVLNTYNSGNHTGWHLPYVDGVDKAELNWDLEKLQQVSVARCSRISYTPFDSDKRDIGADLKQFASLLGSSPVHASPAGHQGTPDEVVHIPLSKGALVTWGNPKEHGNFCGWRQFRKMLPNEAIMDDHYSYELGEF